MALNSSPSRENEKLTPLMSSRNAHTRADLIGSNLVTAVELLNAGLLNRHAALSAVLKTGHVTIEQLKNAGLDNRDGLVSLAGLVAEGLMSIEQLDESRSTFGPRLLGQAERFASFWKGGLLQRAKPTLGSFYCRDRVPPTTANRK